MRKATVTQKQIISLATANSSLSQAEIARMIDCSREYVRQILFREDITLGEKKPKQRTCKTCRNLIAPYSQVELCPDCKRKTRWSFYKCDFCGQKHEGIRAEKERHKYHFCNRTCLGKWAGKNYGFSVHPENANKGGKKRKMLEHQIIDVKDIPPKARSLQKLEQLISEVTKLEPGKALLVSFSSHNLASTTKYGLIKRLFNLGYTCRTATRRDRKTGKVTLFCWDVKLLAEEEEKANETISS